MSLDKLNLLYQEFILEHVDHPLNYGRIENPTHTMEALNPSCGDVIMVEVVVEDGLIQQIGWTGEGCSISLASASMMTQSLLNQSLDKAQQIIENFAFFVGGPSPTKKAKLNTNEFESLIQDAYYLNGVKQFPQRYQCAVMAWHAVEQALHNEEED